MPSQIFFFFFFFFFRKDANQKSLSPALLRFLQSRIYIFFFLHLVCLVMHHYGQRAAAGGNEAFYFAILSRRAQLEEVHRLVTWPAGGVSAPSVTAGRSSSSSRFTVRHVKSKSTESITKNESFLVEFFPNLRLIWWCHRDSWLVVDSRLFSLSLATNDTRWKTLLLNSGETFSNSVSIRCCRTFTSSL